MLITLNPKRFGGKEHRYIQRTDESTLYFYNKIDASEKEHRRSCASKN